MFKKTLYEMRFRLTVFIVLFFVLLLGLIFTRPVIGNLMVSMDMNSEEVKELPDILKGFADGKEFEQLKDDDQFFLLSQWYGKNFGQFLPFFALIIAFPVFSRETEKKTIYFLLSRRNRKEIYDSKVLSGYYVMILIVVVFDFLAPVAMMLSGYDILFNGNLIRLIVQQLIAASFFYFLFILFSIIFNDQMKPVILGIVLIVALPFSSLINGIAWLNLYPYVFGETVLSSGDFDWMRSLVLTGLSIFLYLGGRRLFLKKEF
ncbi:MAG TPA: ABC transporter permease subunit [Thermotogota bacterium]|nr:ABC transporter permease subunit [Thermotogota bacterium]